MVRTTATSDIEAVGVLAEPIRRRLYEYVARQPQPVGRDEAAEALAISRALAAFHLDRMVREGLLTAEYRRTSGRTGPGAGRPAKLYRRASRQLDISFPPRHYELAAQLFARALDGHGGKPPRDALAEAAQEFGRDLGKEARKRAGDRRGARDRAPAAPPDASTATESEEPEVEALLEEGIEVLERYGFEPYAAEEETIRLRNCPFDALAREHHDLVCGMNLWLMQGFLDGLAAAGISARLDERPDTCCVALCREGQAVT